MTRADKNKIVASAFLILMACSFSLASAGCGENKQAGIRYHPQPRPTPGRPPAAPQVTNNPTLVPVEVECVADYNCLENQVCEDNKCVDVIVEKGECQINDDCGIGETCISGSCMVEDQGPPDGSGNKNVVGGEEGEINGNGDDPNPPPTPWISNFFTSQFNTVTKMVSQLPSLSQDQLSGMFKDLNNNESKGEGDERTIPEEEIDLGLPLLKEDVDPSMYLEDEGKILVFAVDDQNRLTYTAWNGESGMNQGWKNGENYGVIAEGAFQYETEPKLHVVRNHYNGNIEIFARDGNFLIRHWYYSLSNETWYQTRPLNDGQSNFQYYIQGDIDAIYNPDAQSIEVYATTSFSINEAGPLRLWYWKSGMQDWSFPQQVSNPQICGTPAAFYNPEKQRIEVYGVSKKGQLFRWTSTEKDSAKKSFSNRSETYFDGFHGSLSICEEECALSVTYAPISRNVFVFGLTSESMEKVISAFRIHPDGTHSHYKLGGILTDLKSSVASIYDQGTGNIDIYAWAGQGLERWRWNSQKGLFESKNDGGGFSAIFTSLESCPKQISIIANPVDAWFAAKYEIFTVADEKLLHWYSGNGFNWKPDHSPWANRSHVSNPAVITVPETYKTRMFGGSGGGQFIASCPVGTYLAGFHGYAGANVDSLGPICRNIYSLQTGQKISYDGLKGSEEYLCPTLVTGKGGVVRGIGVKHGDYNDGGHDVILNITVYCGQLLENSSGYHVVNNDPNVDKIMEIGIGSGDGIVYPPETYYFPPNTIPTGIFGRVGDRLDAIGFTYIPLK